MDEDRPEREVFYLPEGCSALVIVNTMLAAITGWDLRWRHSLVGNNTIYRLVVCEVQEGGE